MKKNWVTVVLGFLALAAWCACALLAQRAARMAPGPSVRWEEDSGVSAAQWTRAERWTGEDGGDFPEAVLWRTMEGAVSRTDGVRSAAPDLIGVFGDPGLLWPLGFTAGNWPARGDGEGCALSEDVADALWGGTDVVGQCVRYQGRTYYVRGVFQGRTGLAVFQGDGDGAERYQRMLMALPGGPEEGRAFLSRAGLPQGECLDLELLAWGLGVLAALPAALLGLGILGRLLGRLWALRYAPLLLVQFVVPALAGGGAVLGALGFPPKIPARLIPGRLSDFSFWTGLLGQWSGAMKGELTSPLTAWDLALWGTALGCVLLAPVAAVLALSWARRAGAGTGRELFLGALACPAVLFAVLLLAAPFGGAAAQRGVWLTPPLWLAADWCLARHRRALRLNEERREDHGALPQAGETGRPAELETGV